MAGREVLATDEQARPWVDQGRATEARPGDERDSSQRAAAVRPVCEQFAQGAPKGPERRGHLGVRRRGRMVESTRGELVWRFEPADRRRSHVRAAWLP